MNVYAGTNFVLEAALRQEQYREFEEVFMPEMTISIPVSEIARMIMAMSKQEVETLMTLLTEEGAELLERKRDIESGKVRLLTRDEVFDV
ncbi:hypothetical protein QUF72_15125 [Desulfobacterales bacterium HSG2]|nr:hypothetical protein [Desulfobacterales bacterium HSG2]